jgi:cysteine desulfurase NifS
MSVLYKKETIHWKKAICGICPAGCWVQVGMNNGKMVDIKADQGHQLGMLCRRGEHAPEMVYSENRLQYPLKRKGKKGSLEFDRISWDEAFEIIVANLEHIKEESGPEAVSIYTGRGAFELSLCDIFQPRNVAVSSASNVLFPFGSPNTMGVGALCYVSFAMIAPHVTMGRMLINMFTDMENSELLLVWGANPATDSPPLDMYRLEAAAKRGAEIMVIDPRKTETVNRTGAKWIPIRPGTDGALALSMISVMIDEEIYDDNFAENWCHGFDELARYAQHFHPEAAETITGVPADTIRHIARKIAKSNGACPVMYTGLEYSNSGIQAIRAVLILFSLAGQLDVPGGIGLAMLNSHFPINRSCNQPNPNLKKAVARDKFPIYSQYRGESHASGLVTSVLDGKPYRIRGLIVHGASLLTSWPQTPIWKETLSKLDFLVCIDRQLTADAAYADIVLPATTMFEINSYMTYGPIFRIRDKVIEPVGEARNDYLIMAELAKRLGYGDLYPQSEEALLQFVLQDSGFTLDEVREAGGWVKIPSPMMDYKKWEKGGLREDGKPGFATPTGKFEIWSTVLEDYGYEPLPKYVEPTEGPLSRPDLAAKFPLVFNSGARPQSDFRSQHHGITGLVEDHPEPIVEINVSDAGKRKIISGDLVAVHTPRGSVTFRALVTENIAPGAIECNMGGGTPVGPKPWQEWNVNELTDLENYDDISGFPVYKALLCDVVKMENAAGRATESRKPGRTNTEKKLFDIQVTRKKVKRHIYLDNNATTEVLPEVKDAMLPFLTQSYGNPSALHEVGYQAREGLDNARRQVARLINAKLNRLIFTGCGSEANNLALKGITLAHQNSGKHIITSSIEHPAILKTTAFLEKIGFRVTYLAVDHDGYISPQVLKKAITPETTLISIMMANNEVGTIQPIAELCHLAHQHDIVFHTDAVQAAGKIEIDVEELQVDLLTLSGHKFNGPKGVGVLYMRKGIELEPLIHGGKQEKGWRAGTENVPGIVGMGKAAELALPTLTKSHKITELRDYLEKGIIKLIPTAIINGHQILRLPNTLNLILPGLRGESLVVAMDQHGVALSSGSACKAGSPDPTHVLLAMGRTPEEAHCSVRFSLSHKTTRKDIDFTLTALSEVLAEMESTVRFLPCK